MATITQVTVSFGLTQSLPDYCNTKPSVSLTATLDEGDDAAEVRRDLLAQCRQDVEAQVDLALEQAGRPARYSTEPRYKVLRSYVSSFDEHAGASTLLVILPHAARPALLDDLHMSGANYHGEATRLRLSMARNVAQAALADLVDAGKEVVFVDCSGSDAAANEHSLASAVERAKPRQQVETPVAAGAQVDDDDDQEWEGDDD